MKNIPERIHISKIKPVTGILQPQNLHLPLQKTKEIIGSCKIGGILFEQLSQIHFDDKTGVLQPFVRRNMFVVAKPEM